MGKKIAGTLVVFMTIISCSVMLSYDDADTLKKFSGEVAGVLYTSLNNVTMKVSEQISKFLKQDKPQNIIKDADKQVPVFKTEYSVLSKQLSAEDKDGILSAARRLAPVDYERINQYLGIGEDKQIIMAVKLLKDRLTSKEYQPVEKIMKGYISEQSLRIELETGVGGRAK